MKKTVLASILALAFSSFAHAVTFSCTSGSLANGPHPSIDFASGQGERDLFTAEGLTYSLELPPVHVSPLFIIRVKSASTSGELKTRQTITGTALGEFSLQDTDANIQIICLQK